VLVPPVWGRAQARSHAHTLGGASFAHLLLPTGYAHCCLFCRTVLSKLACRSYPSHPERAPCTSLPPHHSRLSPCITSNDTAYGAARNSTPPLSGAAAAALPPVPATRPYALARQRGAYLFETQSSCRCSPHGWRYLPPAAARPLANGGGGGGNTTFFGCADPGNRLLTAGAWCPVDPRECHSYNGAYVTARNASVVYYDYW
jgi:hypothetical protein